MYHHTLRTQNFTIMVYTIRVLYYLFILSWLIEVVRLMANDRLEYVMALHNPLMDVFLLIKNKIKNKLGRGSGLWSINQLHYPYNSCIQVYLNHRLKKIVSNSFAVQIPCCCIYIYHVFRKHWRQWSPISFCLHLLYF